MNLDSSTRDSSTHIPSITHGGYVNCLAATGNGAPATGWVGDWNTSSDGVYETRSSVAAAADGFLPALEVSQRGGDCSARYGDAVRSLERATLQALANERAWHIAHDMADLDRAGLIF